MLGGLRPHGNAYRIHAGEYLVYLWNAVLTTNNNTIPLSSQARLIYDDGTEDLISFPAQAIAGVASNVNFASVTGSHAALKNGWLVEWSWDQLVKTLPRNAIWIAAYISPSSELGMSYQCVAMGPKLNVGNLGLGIFIDDTPDRWPLWIFQGTVAEDATVGTHVCTLTVQPGLIGSAASFDLIYGSITMTGAAGLSAKAQINDGSGNMLSQLMAPQTVATTYAFPGAIGAQAGASAGTPIRLSSTMTLVLTATTSTVSDTQSFAVACRVHPKAVPIATLADNTGTPTLTVNTNLVV